jgi:superfamily II DNA or RNA helicase
MKYTLLRGNDPKKIAFAIKEGDKTVQIEGKKGEETLRALTSKGELFLSGKKLLYDPFVTFQVLIELHGLQVHPFFFYKNHKIPFHVCPLILMDALDVFVYEGIVRKFDGGFPKMGRFFSSIVELKPTELKEFTDSYLIDPPEWGPKVLEITKVEESCFIPDEKEAVYTIQLTDETGAFINPSVENSTEEGKKRFYQDILDAGYAYKPIGSSSHYCPTHEVKEALGLLNGLGYKIVGPNHEPVLFFYDYQEKRTVGEKSFTVDAGFKTNQGNFSLKDALDAHQKGKVLLKKGEASLFLDAKVLEKYQKIPHKIEKETLVYQRFYAPQLLYRLDQEGIDGLVPFSSMSTTKDFKGELFPFQKEGLDWLYFHYNNRFAALLADEMGLGKTVQTIAFMGAILKDKKALIVTPLTLLSQWKHEITKFYPSLKVHIYDKKGGSIEPGVTLISYQMLRSSIESIKEIPFELLVLDEAQVLRNKKTKGFEAVSKIDAKFKLGLSGTPIENHVCDLVNLFSILFPELTAEMDTQDPDRIKTLTRPFILRRLKKEVVQEMPEKMEQIIYIDLYEDQKVSYDSLRSESIAKLKENEGHVFSIMTKLRQHVLTPKLVDLDLPSAKFDRVLEDLIEHVGGGQKVLFFSHFSSLLEILDKELKELGISVYFLDGKTRNRDKIVQDFKNHEGGTVFLMTLKAGGVGLNLVEADTVMLFEPWWNPQAEIQAIDRAHRVGRQKPLLARRYIVLNTIEEHMESIKKGKVELASQMIEESQVSKEILEKLLEEIL